MTTARRSALPGQIRHRGIAMLLVLIAVAMATILSMSFLSSQTTSMGVAQNVQGHAQARSVAESALVVAIKYVQTDADWRTDKSEGQWVTNASFNGGTFDLYAYDGLDTDGDGVVDDTDGDLADDASDPVTLKVVADVDGVSHTVFAVVTTGEAEDGITVLMIVGNAASLNSRDNAKKDLMEGWGMTVNLISDNDSQATYDAAAALADVAYIAESVNSGTVGSKATGFTIGVVNDEPYLNDSLEVTSSNASTFDDNRIDIVDNSHYITSTIADGDMDNLVVNSSTERMYRAVGTLGSGATVLATRDSNSDPTIVVVEAGGQLEDGSSAAGRRVILPWGSSYDMSALNSAGQEIMERSLRWAAVQSTSSGITYEGFSESKASSSTSSITVSTPTDTAEGDLLIAAVATDSAESLSASGWTQIAHDDQGNVTLGVWWKLATASEPSSHTFTWGSDEEAYAWIMRFTGHHPTAPIDDYATSGGSSSSPTSPSVTTTVANAMVLRVGGFDDDDISTDSTGLSGHATITMDESGSGGGTASGGAGYVIQGTAGASGTSNFSLTNSEQYRTVTIAIAPDDSAGGSGSGEEPNLIALYEFIETPPPAPNLVGHWQLDDAAGVAAAGISARSIVITDSGIVDSFDSSSGAYGGGNVGSAANLSTNLTTSGAVTVGGSAEIRGSVYVGAGGSPGTAISNSGTITGATGTLSENPTIPTVYEPTGMPANQGDVTLDSGTTVYSSDQQFDKFTLDSSAVLQISGNVTILANDEFKLDSSSQLQLLPGATLKLYLKDKYKAASSAQANVNTADPSRFIIYGLSNKHIDFEDSSHTYATVIAPDGLLHVKDSSHYYGKFITDEVEVEGSGELHQDVSGASSGTSQVGFPTAYGSQQDANSSRLRATRVTFAEAGEVQSISAYVRGPASRDVAFALYDDNSGEPGNLIVVSSADRMDTGSWHWHTIPVTPTSVSAGDYWLAIGFESSNMYYAYTSSGTTRHKVAYPISSGFPSSWGSSGYAPNRKISIYANVSVASAPEPVTTVDEISANDGTSSGGVTAEASGNGDGGTSLEFDGVDGYMEIPHSDAYLLDSGSVSFWFNADSTTGHQGLFSKDSNDFDTGGHLHVYLDGATLTARLQDTSTTYTVQSSGISSGTWYHAVVSWGAGGLKLFRNGVEMDSDSYTGGLGTTSGAAGNYEPLVIGASTWTSDDLVVTPVTYPFDGRIDDVRIYDAGFNATQAGNVYAGSAPGQGDAITVYDTSGYGTALDLEIEDYGNVTWVGGGGLTLDSETRIVSPSPATKLYDALTATDEFSLEVQFTTANTTQSGPARIVSYSGGAASRNVTFGQDGDEFITRLRTSSTTSNGTPSADSGSALVGGSQAHVIVSYDGENITMYQNGGSSTSLARTGTLSWDNSFNFMLGNEAIDGYDWLGTLHRVAIYDEAFNQTQADNVFGGGDPGDGETGSGGAVNSVDWVER